VAQPCFVFAQGLTAQEAIKDLINDRRIRVELGDMMADVFFFVSNRASPARSDWPRG
jgi:hypothetical protein